MKLNEKQEGNLLIDIYGNLLTSHQLEVLTDYYINDFSMQEIADNNNVSKAAISDIIKRSTEQLKDYEKNLGLLKQSNKIEDLINEMEKDKINSKYINKLRKINRG